MSSIAEEVKKQDTAKETGTAINHQDRILSLSGGGVKGIAELVVLAEIEGFCRIYQKLQKMVTTLCGFQGKILTIL